MPAGAHLEQAGVERISAVMRPNERCPHPRQLRDAAEDVKELLRQRGGQPRHERAYIASRFALADSTLRAASLLHAARRGARPRTPGFPKAATVACMARLSSVCRVISFL